MEEPQLDARGVGGLGELGLRLPDKPVAGQNSAVLVAVAIADHDFLERAGAAVAALQVAQRSHGHGVRQEFREHAARAFEVIDSLEERGDRDLRHKTLGRGADQTGFACEQVNVEQVRSAVGHAHDERADALAAVKRRPIAHQA